MSAPTFVFLHVGGDTLLPRLLAASIARVQTGARIIQCTDAATPVVPGVTQVHRMDGDTTRLMAFRLAAFASLGLREVAMYLDTDMLCVRQLDPAQMLAGHDVAVCRREFDCDAPFSTAFRGMNLQQYAGQTMGGVYPYLACATITRDADFWRDCQRSLAPLDEQFQCWYGDQEAIRATVRRGAWRVGHLQESLFARLPDKPSPGSGKPYILHFKGAGRKALMLACAQQLQLAC